MFPFPNNKDELEKESSIKNNQNKGQIEIMETLNPQNYMGQSNNQLFQFLVPNPIQPIQQPKQNLSSDYQQPFQQQFFQPGQVPKQQPNNPIPFQNSFNQQQFLANASNQQNPQTSSQQYQPQQQPPANILNQQNPQYLSPLITVPPQSQQFQQPNVQPAKQLPFQQNNQNLQNIQQGQQFAFNQQFVQSGQQFTLNPQKLQPLSNAQIPQQQLTQNIYNKPIPQTQSGQVQSFVLNIQKQQNPLFGQINAQHKPLLAQGSQISQGVPIQQSSQQNSLDKFAQQPQNMNPLPLKHWESAQDGQVQSIIPQDSQNKKKTSNIFEKLVHPKYYQELEKFLALNLDQNSKFSEVKILAQFITTKVKNILEEKNSIH